MILWLLSRLAGGDAVLFTALWLPMATFLPIFAGIWLHTNLEMPALRWGKEIAYGWSRARIR